MFKYNYLFPLALIAPTDPLPPSQSIKPLTLEEYLLKKKKKKKQHREDERSSRKVGHVHNKAVQTVCGGLAADFPLPAAVKTERRETCDRHRPSLKLEHSPFLSHQDHSIRGSCLQTASCFGRLMHEEQQPNGGGSVLHAYADELACLSPAQMECFAREFLELTFAERSRGASAYALTVVHGAASYLPDFLDYFAFNYPNTPVKMEILAKKDIETTTIANFHSQVAPTSFCRDLSVSERSRCDEMKRVCAVKLTEGLLHPGESNVLFRDVPLRTHEADELGGGRGRGSGRLFSRVLGHAGGVALPQGQRKIPQIGRVFAICSGIRWVSQLQLIKAGAGPPQAGSCCWNMCCSC